MPAQRPAAVFEPISPDLDLAALVEQTPNFQYVDRIPCDMIDGEGLEQFEKVVLLHVILGGKPLVIDGYNNRLNQWTYSTQWLRDNIGKKFEQARSLEKGENLPLSINHYLENMPMLANQWNRYNYKEKNRQRLYLKDIDCPPLWHEKLKESIPPELFYLNDSTGDPGGPGSLDEQPPHGIGSKKGRGIAKSGDLMSVLPSHMRAENLMCYIGHEGTYTPAHREMCASLGQNIMVEASGTIGEDGIPTKPGSSIWFMTETKDRHLVSEYWLSSLGHDIEVESHFAQINAWKQAPFTVYIVEQKVGDFLLIPPLAPHQVWNRGTRTMKVAWNRTTVETLELALNEALPRARMVCRDEQYKNKAIILFALNRYSALLRRVDSQRHGTQDEQTLRDLKHGHKIKQLRRDFKRLFLLYHEIMLSESFNPHILEKKVEYVPYDSFVTCSYCRCNIFNRFLTCKSCLVHFEDGQEDTYDICMECYAMGRSCRCISKLTWVEQFPWKDLLEKHQIWRDQIVALDGKISSKTPLPLNEARKQLPKKTLAHICQEQLRLRPFKDPRKPKEEEEDESESDGVNEDGTIKKKPKKKRSEKWFKEHLPCHICVHREIRWKLAICGCGTAYCYGSLWRAFDIMPQTVMEDLDWKCPKCRKICNCSPCRKNQSNRPYEPNGTVLGHDTRKFADPRSIESLVDFSFSNMHWLKKAGEDHPTDTKRMGRRISEAAVAKANGPSLDEHYVDDDPALAAEISDVPIDPQLMGPNVAETSGAHARQAALALSAMGELSQLEQYPEAFMAEAGLMSGKFKRNGINYEYPDPDSSQHLSAAVQQDDDDGRIRKTKSKKKKRTDHLQKVQSNAAAFTDDANKRFYLEQSQKTLIEAKRTGRFIIAKAAITGDSLIVKLKIDPWRLSRFEPTAQIVTTNEVTNEHMPVLVQSDLPKNTPKSIAEQRNPQVPKKRQRGEVDEDFVTKRRIVDSRAEDNASVNSHESEPDEESDVEAPSSAKLKPINGTEPRRRALPAYLARKSPMEDEEIPKELSNEPRRRTAQLKPSQGKRPKGQSEPSVPPPAADVTIEYQQSASAAPMASLMMPSQNAANDLEDAEFEFENPDISMPGIVFTSHVPTATENLIASEPEDARMPAVGVSSEKTSSTSSETMAQGLSPAITKLPALSHPIRAPSAGNLSNESSEYEAPPKPATPTESEVSTRTPTPVAEPAHKSKRREVKAKSMDSAALNRLAKQRAAAGEMMSDGYESDLNSSDDSLIEKPSKVSVLVRGKIPANTTTGMPSSAGRGRGRPRKSDASAPVENKSINSTPARRTSLGSRGGRGRGRGRAKIISSK